MAGTLYLIATPIGNLEDITFRAVRTLREVDRIACEDTRHTRRLLDHYGIDKPMVSYHEHNERERTAELVEWLRSDTSIALVSDAGTPLISDPGYRLVEGAVAAGIRVVPIPGPSAAIAALTASGLPTDSFFFGGFLPPRSTARRKMLETVGALPCVLIFYEAPHRLLETLSELEVIAGDREIVVARELTKMHEEIVRGNPEQLLQHFAARAGVKGEVTLLIGKPPDRPREVGSIRAVFQAHLETGMSRMDAMKATARDCGLPKRAVYLEIEKGSS